jgi:uncharacterized protein YndB with AHSA1/START domain
MKPFVVAIMSLLVAVAAAYAGSFLLPEACQVYRAVVVDATPEQVFPYLNNPTEWEKWNAWNEEYDPTMIRLYGGPMAGKGAYQQWNGDKVGHVQMHFTESVPPSQLYYRQQTKGETHETIGIFSLEKVPDGTRVVWQQRTELDDTALARYIGFLKKLRIEEEAEQSLLALKTLFNNGSTKKAS